MYSNSHYQQPSTEHNKLPLESDYRVFSNPLHQLSQYQLYDPPLPPGHPNAHHIPYFKPVQKHGRGWRAWVHRHPFATGWLAVLAVVIIILTAVLGGCSRTGCASLGNSNSRHATLQGQDPYPNTLHLLLAFNNASTDAWDLLPPNIKQYTNRTRLPSSNIQVLSFSDVVFLEPARQALEGNTDLLFIVRGWQLANDQLTIGSTPNRRRKLSSIHDRSQSIHQHDSTKVLTAHDGHGDVPAIQLRGLQQIATSGSTIPDGSEWYMNKLEVQESWAAGTGSSDVVVAIISSGVDITHPGLQSSLWVNAKEIPGNGIDDDGNGYVDDIHGSDFTAMSCGTAEPCDSARQTASQTLHDSSGTGTAMAGVLAAQSNNGSGIDGVAPGVKIMVLKVTSSSDGSVYASSVVMAMDYAARMGAHIVQTSIGGRFVSGFSASITAPAYQQDWTRVMTAAMMPLSASGALVIAAAGDTGMDLDELKANGYSYPPCLTQLPNVMCVMATQADDNTTATTSYGAHTVQLAAPGQDILTTLPGGQYGYVSGSSIAASITAGVASLSLSVLGAADNNYYQGVQVKTEMLQSVQPQAGLPCQASGRVSSSGAVSRALAIATNISTASGTDLISTQAYMPIPQTLANTSTHTNSSFTWPDPAAYRPGFLETYYQIPGGWNISELPDQDMLATWVVLDRAVRSTSSAMFLDYKYQSGVLVSITSHLLVQQAGIWRVRVSTTDSSTMKKLLINQQGVKLTDTGNAAFVAQTIGLYKWELQLMAPSLNTVSFEVQLPSPQLLNMSINSDGWMISTGHYTLADTRYIPPAMGPAYTPSAHFEASLLYAGWVLRYNLTQFWPLATNLTNTTVASQISAPGLPLWYSSFLAGHTVPSFSVPSTENASTFKALRYVRQTTMPDLEFLQPTALESSLFPGGISGQFADGNVTAARDPTTYPTLGVSGWVTTVLKSSKLPRRIVIKVLCRSCLLLINDLPVLDVYEPAASVAMITSNTPLPAQKTACITLHQHEMQRISVFFAATNISYAPLSLTWAECGQSDNPSAFQSFAGYVGTPDVWDVTSTVNTTGSVEGVQCDVWLHGSMPRPGSPTSSLLPAAGNPPNPNNPSSASWAWWYNSSSPAAAPLLKARFPAALCSGGLDCGAANWAFMLEAAFPGLSSAAHGQRFDIRCWSYWAGSFSAVSGPNTLPVDATSPSAVYLAGQQGWSSAWSADSPPAAAVSPTATQSSPGMYQQLVVDWVSITATTYLVLSDGQTVVQMDPTSMRLPVATATHTTNISTLDHIPVGGVVVGAAGHYSLASSPAASDMQSLVTTQLAGQAVLGFADLPSRGLDVTAIYNTSIGSMVRFTQAHGFLLGFLSQAQQFELVWTDSANSSATIVSGGVTLLNARPFDTTGSPAQQRALNVTIPPGSYLPMAVIVKMNRDDGRTQLC